MTVGGTFTANLGCAHDASDDTSLESPPAYYGGFADCVSKMNIDLEDLKAFVATAEMQSFLRRVTNSQPALTRRIQKLEGVLGVPLPAHSR